jgi:hypothetical protein
MRGYKKGWCRWKENVLRNGIWSGFLRKPHELLDKLAQAIILLSAPSPLSKSAHMFYISFCNFVHQHYIDLSYIAYNDNETVHLVA